MINMINKYLFSKILRFNQDQKIFILLIIILINISLHTNRSAELLADGFKNFGGMHREPSV